MIVTTKITMTEPIPIACWVPDYKYTVQLDNPFGWSVISGGPFKVPLLFVQSLISVECSMQFLLLVLTAIHVQHKLYTTSLRVAPLLRYHYWRKYRRHKGYWKLVQHSSILVGKRITISICVGSWEYGGNHYVEDDF